MKNETIICDANILIDYYQSNKNILALTAEHSYNIYIPRDILNEVKQLSEKEAGQLGLKIIDATIEQIIDANHYEGSLSFQDYICFVISRDNNYICATNEKTLYNKCKKENVKTIRGLKFLINLCKINKLTKRQAVNIAKKIEKNNVRITQKIINDFIKIINKI